MVIRIMLLLLLLKEKKESKGETLSWESDSLEEYKDHIEGSAGQITEQALTPLNQAAVFGRAAAAAADLVGNAAAALVVPACLPADAQVDRRQKQQRESTSHTRTFPPSLLIRAKSFSIAESPTISAHTHLVVVDRMFHKSQRPQRQSAGELIYKEAAAAKEEKEKEEV